MITGQGIPSKIKASGTIYLDVLSGAKYKQTQYPNGNVWISINSSSDSSITTFVDGVMYCTKRVLDYDEIVELSGTPITIAEISTTNTSPEFAFVNIGIASFFSGTYFGRSNPGDSSFYMNILENNTSTFLLSENSFGSRGFIGSTNSQNDRVQTKLSFRKYDLNDFSGEMDIVLREDIQPGGIASGGASDSELTIYTYYRFHTE